MKKIPALLALVCLCLYTKGQKKDFEGHLIYNVSVRAKSKELDAKFCKLLFAANGEREVVYIKNGMMKQNIGLCETWYIGKSKRVYLKFKNIDTLFYRDYSAESPTVTDITRSDSSADIQGYRCKSILLKRSGSTAHFMYTDSLQLNIEYEKDNTLDNMNILIREIGTAMWLYSQCDYPIAIVTDSCLQVVQGPVDDHLFDLPSAPQRPLSEESLIHKASFPGGATAWARYLQNNLNESLGPRYIKIPKGEKEAAVQVQLSFVVSEDGSISNIVVTNKAGVDSHLANEAMRVIRESPPWKAATIFGIQTKMTATQSIVFKVVQ
ncbi:MAG TPA: energy transducer TonB [Puia sp.]|nr:energy transducer TonB [Puia sp.]